MTQIEPITGTDIDNERKTDLDTDTLDKLIEHFSVHDREILRNRLAVYDRMRTTCPVAHSVEHGGFYAVSTYKQIYEVTHKPEIFSSFPVTIPPFGNPVPMIPIEADPPDHAKYRALVGQVFSPKRIEALDGQIRKLVNELLDSIEGKREVDLAKEIGLALPLAVVFDSFLGFPREDWDRLYSLAFTMLSPDPDATDEDNQEASAAAGLEMMVYCGGLLNDLRENGYGEDLISALDQSYIDGERLEEDDVLGFCLLLIPAGFDTTATTVSRILQLFATNPEVRESVRQRIDDSQALDLAVDELIRYVSTVSGLARTVTQPFELGGQQLDAGDRVLLLFPSANRDPEEFPNADDFVVDRKPNRHMAFGSGVHRCLGSHVARKEVKVLLEEMFRRGFVDYKLDPDNPPVWHTGNTWGVKSLPVIFENNS